MSTNKVEKMLGRAVQFATDNRHEYITIEHLLLSLLYEKDVDDALQNMGAQPAKIKAEVIAYLADPALQLPPDAPAVMPKRTGVLQRTFQRAMTQEIFNGQKEITNVKVLVSITYEDESFANHFLKKQGVTRDKLLDSLKKEGEKAEGNESPLAQYARNLNKEAADGSIDPVIGREKEVADTVEILARRRKNNVVYVGEPGVGKTALAEGLALKITKKEVPPALQEKVVYSLDIGSMLAGTKFRGDFEERMNGVLKEVKKLGNVILFIDEIHMILGAGATSGSTMDASNLLKPMLAKGQLMCVGATTYDEFHEHFEKDKALLRRFQKYDIDQPSAEQTKLILKGLLKHYEKFHGVEYAEGTVDLCVDLAERYMKQKFFPDKAIDVLDAAGAKAKLDESPTVTEAIVIEQAAKIARVKKDAIDVKANDALIQLKPRLKNAVYGQDEAIEVLVNAIYLAKAGLREANKPVGNFLFTGPTGSGKTYTAKKLAELLGVKLVRFDMSEYMEKHTVSKLIGAPPGYVGHGEGKMGEGQLIAEIDANPDCVLLLDEIEKAHPDVFTILLQVMDDGRLTSSKGKTVDFSHVTILMSANAGAAMAEKNLIGFGNVANTIAVDEELKRLFTPEFRNRIDAIVKFNKLGMTEMKMIVDAEITNTENMLSDKNITINVSLDAREELAKQGLDPKMGARPFKRYFEKNIKLPLAQEVLFKGLVGGGHVFVDLVDGKFDIKVTKKEPVIQLLEDSTQPT